MVSERSWFQATSLQFESLFVYLKVYERLYLICFIFHIRDDVKDMIFILNQNPESLNF